METIIVAAYNLSVEAVKRHPVDVQDDIERFLAEADVLCLVECGEAQKILERVQRKTGCGIYDGSGRPGQASTAVVFKRPLRDRRSVFLTPATAVGDAGAGPGTLKPKWLHLVKLRFYGRRSWFGVIHTAPSVYIEVRKRLALRQTGRTATVMRILRGCKFVGGDFNSEPHDAIRIPLKRAGLLSSQQELKQIDTMGHRSIDDVHYSKGRKVNAVKHWTRKGASDHDAYFCEFEVKPSVAWRIRNRNKRA